MPAMAPFGDAALVLLSPRGVPQPIESMIIDIRRLAPTLPIVALAEFATSHERALWIEAGIDDVLTTDCGPREFLARVWRRARKTVPEPSILTAGPVTINVASRVTLVHGQPVSLTRTEFAILTRILRAGLVTHDEIVTQVLGLRDRFETSKVRFHVANLRSKLGTARNLIETVPPRALRLKLPKTVCQCVRRRSPALYKR
jgi:DNA-binding response OmpR family regulator